MSFILELFSFLLPDRIKRMIFLASLNAKINNMRNPSVEALNKLNNVLALATNTKAMELPMEISYSIWSGFNTKELINRGFSCAGLPGINYRAMTSSQKLDLANCVIKNAPKWLRYNDATSMQTDLLKMFNEC